MSEALSVCDSSDSDDSSAASSGDEMLNMVVPFLSQESGKSPGKGSESEGSDVSGGVAVTPKPLGNKRKRDDADGGAGVEATDVGDKAGEKARKAFKEEFGDYSKIGTPDKLFWRDTSKKGKRMIYPVRVVAREEVVGIALEEWNDETHSPICYIKCSLNSGGEGLFDTASRRSLSPYYGKGEKTCWCPIKVEKYLKQLKKERRLNADDLKIEEAFLSCALQKSLMEGEQAKSLKLVDEAMPEEISSDHEAEAAAASGTDDDDEDEETGRARRTPRRSTGARERTEPLRPGDHIEYYAQQSTGGDKRGLRTAEILYIDPRGNGGQPLLTLDDPLTTLQPDHHVKRVKRKRRGKLLENDGVFRAIDEYILKKEGDPEACKKLLARNNAELKEGIQRRKEETLAKMEKDGFGRSFAKDALHM